MRADLHIHTVYSDGAYTPAEIAARVKAAGVELCSMTDHDSLEGLGEKRADSTKTYYADVCTVPASIAGLPAISVPCALDRGGLPIGLQIIADRGCDGLVLSCADFIERQTSVRAQVCREASL